MSAGTIGGRPACQRTVEWLLRTEVRDWGSSMNRRRRRALSAALSALSLPAALVLSVAPPAPAATVLAVEGTWQRARTTQTAFGGAFCKQNTCISVNNAPNPLDAKPGSRQLQAGVDRTDGDLILMGWSLGASSVYDRLREWDNSPSIAPDPQRVKLVVTFGNPENRYGGEARLYPGVGVPEDLPYAHLDVAVQYDSVADRPARWGWYSMINNAFAQHLQYFQGVDINDPDNLIIRNADGSYNMLIKADVLPMLKWIDWFTPDEQMAALDAIFRPLVEKDYDRPAYIPQGEGADWGNGTPPPSVSGSGEQLVAAITPASRSSAVPDGHEEVEDDRADTGPDAPAPAPDADLETELDTEPELEPDLDEAVVTEPEDDPEATEPEPEPDDESEAEDEPEDSDDDTETDDGPAGTDAGGDDAGTGHDQDVA